MRGKVLMTGTVLADGQPIVRAAERRTNRSKLSSALTMIQRRVAIGFGGGDHLERANWEEHFVPFNLLTSGPTRPIQPEGERLWQIVNERPIDSSYRFSCSVDIAPTWCDGSLVEGTEHGHGCPLECRTIARLRQT
uniref:Uncharacterized protein n=1 Tax=Anopheles melas TaxID=34690 RepID=A0A182UG88_9DIPT